MNLFSFLDRGAGHAAILQQRRAEKSREAVARAAEIARVKWLHALTVDATRAWLSIGEKDRNVLSGLVIMLTVAGFCLAHAGGAADHPDLRVFRGAVSAATQCSAAGSVITVEHARAFHVAIERAAGVVRAASVPAIVHAAESIRLAVGIADAEAPGARAATGVLVAGL